MPDTNGSGLLERKTVSIAGKDIPVWPEDRLQLKNFDKNVVLGFNADLAPLHQPLINALLRLDMQQRIDNPRERCTGGQKLRDLDKLGLPIFDIINERILQLFRVTTGNKTAFADDIWANAVHEGEYTMPHAHKRSLGSGVYMLDPGVDPESGFEPMNGVLMFADPRMPACCQHKDGYVSTPAVVPRQKGAMIMFPSQLTHQVTPYQGPSPRISIAWNINPTPRGDKPAHDGILTD